LCVEYSSSTRAIGLFKSAGVPKTDVHVSCSKAGVQSKGISLFEGRILSALKYENPYPSITVYYTIGVAPFLPPPLCIR